MDLILIALATAVYIGIVALGATYAGLSDLKEDCDSDQRRV
jgi:hypothetical protein